MVSLGTEGIKAFDLLSLGTFIDRKDRPQASARGQRRVFPFGEGVDADQELLARFNRAQTVGVGFNEALFHIRVFDRGNRASHVEHLLQFGLRLFDQLLGSLFDHDGAFEDVGVLKQVCLVGQDLLNT